MDGVVQTVQGGIDEGETPQQAAVRELAEEIGLQPDQYKFVGASKTKYRYDWPRQFFDQLVNKTYVGQEQQYFLIEVDSNVEFKLDTHHREFKSVCWGTSQELIDMAWYKKRPGLEGALREFGLFARNA